MDFAEPKIQPEQEVISTVSIEAGGRLRDTRHKQGFTLQRVEQMAAQIATTLSNQEFAVPMSRLSHIETKGVVPSIYRIHSLARIYRLSPDTILQWYGINHEKLEEVELGGSPRGRFARFRRPKEVAIPVAIDPAFDPRVTAELGRMVEEWGDVPFAFLGHFRRHRFIYGYIGTEDFLMFPVLPPGSFVQIDPSRKTVRKGSWQNEYDRPIYAVETRMGLYCCWCSIIDRKLVLQPHPLSKEDARIFKLDEVDVIGQVVGVATRFRGAASSPANMPVR